MLGCQHSGLSLGGGGEAPECICGLCRDNPVPDLNLRYLYGQIQSPQPKPLGHGLSQILCCLHKLYSVHIKLTTRNANLYKTYFLLLLCHILAKKQSTYNAQL